MCTECGEARAGQGASMRIAGDVEWIHARLRFVAARRTITRSTNLRRSLAAFALLTFLITGGTPNRVSTQSNDPGCQSSTLVSTGGGFPGNPLTLAVRWTGYSNFELAYKNQIILLDAYFDRGSLYPALGFSAADIKRADVILIGHGHHDHMSDAASVAMRTGAVVVGAPVTVEKLLAQQVDSKQVRSVVGKGGEELKFRNFTVEPILGRHGEPPPDVTAPFNQALQRTTRRPTAEESAEQAEIRRRGTSDPRVATEGTIAYLITLDNGFRVMYRDSGGTVTDYERAAMARIGRVDIAIAATAASVLPALTSAQALAYMRTYKPDVFIPAHHDGSINDLWRATEPLFQALKDAVFIDLSATES
jgi:L-ascorbate metabolism protein UlaG (beta-lactamase superfamily)